MIAFNLPKKPTKKVKIFVHCAKIISVREHSLSVILIEYWVLISKRLKIFI